MLAMFAHVFPPCFLPYYTAEHSISNWGKTNVVTRIIKDLVSRQLVESHELKGRKKTYRLTKRGELARQVLNNLIEPKTLPDMVRLLNTHRNVVISIIKHLIQNGFVTLFKTIKPARKCYRRLHLPPLSPI
jgi:hypothetical protein